MGARVLTEAPAPAPPAHSALTQKLASSSMRALAIYVVGAGLTYCSQLVIARTVGADSYGVYAYVFAWMTVLAYVAALGFDISLLRQIPAYRARGEWGLARGVLQYAERRCAGVSLLILAIGAGIVWGRSAALGSAMTKTFLIGFPLVPVWALLWIRSSAVRAYGGVISALAPDRVVRDGLLVALLGAATLWPDLKSGSAFVISLTLASSLVGLFLVGWSLRRWRPSEIGAAIPQYAAAAWRPTALPLVLISLGETALNRTGVVLLGMAGLTRDAGIFALTFTIAAAVLLPRTAVNALFAPVVAELFSRREHAALQFVVTRTALWTLASALCIALPIAVFAAPLLSWFGPGFTGGATALRILLLGQVIAAGAGPQMYLLTMTGHERIGSALLVGSVIVNAIGTALLSNRMGLEGAAISMTGALIAFNIAMGVVVWRRLQLIPAGLAIIASARRSLLSGATAK